MRFDVVILDHTYGPEQPGSDHLSAIQVAEHAERMRVEGLLDGQAHVFATHIAHEGIRLMMGWTPSRENTSMKWLTTGWFSKSS